MEFKDLADEYVKKEEEYLRNNKDKVVMMQYIRQNFDEMNRVLKQASLAGRNQYSVLTDLIVKAGYKITERTCKDYILKVKKERALAGNKGGVTPTVTPTPAVVPVLAPAKPVAVAGSKEKPVEKVEPMPAGGLPPLGVLPEGTMGVMDWWKAVDEKLVENLLKRGIKYGYVGDDEELIVRRLIDVYGLYNNKDNPFNDKALKGWQNLHKLVGKDVLYLWTLALKIDKYR